MTEQQEATYLRWKLNHDAEIVEELCCMHNAAYFTVKFGWHYVEYGIWPDGELFIVR